MTWWLEQYAHVSNFGGGITFDLNRQVSLKFFLGVGGGGLTFQSTLKSLIWGAQALANQFLSNVLSHIPVLKYLFVNILPYQNMCTCLLIYVCLLLYLTIIFMSIVFLWVRLSMFMVFLISVLYYACNMLEE